jgi:hypothetical protein
MSFLHRDLRLTVKLVTKLILMFVVGALLGVINWYAGRVTNNHLVGIYGSTAEFLETIAVCCGSCISCYVLILVIAMVEKVNPNSRSKHEVTQTKTTTISVSATTECVVATP